MLLPGEIVPCDGTRDTDIAIDLEFHADDMELIRELGIATIPQNNWELISEPGYFDYRELLRKDFQERGRKKMRKIRGPYLDLINFQDDDIGVGPYKIIELLSTEGRCRYTQAVLDLDATFETRTLEHDSQKQYDPIEDIPQPVIDAIREHGRIEIASGNSVPFKDALGEDPDNREAQRFLLEHPNVDKIREVFDLHDAPTAQPINTEVPQPIFDVWPGLQDFNIDAELRVARCDWFEDICGEIVADRSLKTGDVIYVRRADDEDELREVLELLGHQISDDALHHILYSAKHAAAREEVKKEPTDAARLLKAVGAENLRYELPAPLIKYREHNGIPMSDLEIAEAMIDTYETGALKRCRQHLAHLGPPQRWTSGPGTVRFVESLGFSRSWAGDPNSKRDPYVIIPGPFRLPKAHPYQRRIIDKLQELLNLHRYSNAPRRGLISLPTGAGKTRVAVQGIVEAMQKGEFQGGVLWVANRDELCEQAVESWQQVWSAIGAERTDLRVSKMWGGQGRPEITADPHVVVATIQTLLQRMVKRPSGYEFLQDFSLIVFDEAHQSISTSFNQVMRAIGFERRQKPDDAYVLGLTATPYRGRDEDETRRLVNRYDRNRLDHDVFDSNDPIKVVSELQEDGILARAIDEVIPGGDYIAGVDEDPDGPWLDAATELQIALDSKRTENILDAYHRHIGGQTPHWPTLIFAVSV